MCKWKSIETWARIELKNRYETLESLEDQSNNENIIENLNDSIINPVKEVEKKFKDRNSPNSNKFSEETKKLMKNWRNLKPSTTTREKVEAAELSKTKQKKQRENLRNRTTAIIEDVIKQGRGYKSSRKKMMAQSITLLFRNPMNVGSNPHVVEFRLNT